VIAALLPVKRFANSKQRLAGWLTPSERELLARTMFEDVWEKLTHSGAFAQLLVATAEPYVIARCRESGVLCLVEGEQQSHSLSVRTATEWAMSMGVTTLASVPIDTPAITEEDLQDLMKTAATYDVVIAASGDGAGTNALVRTPPNAIDPHFGPNSCRLHSVQARAAGLSCSVVALPGFAADVDTPEEAERFLALGRPCRTANLLRQYLAARKSASVAAV